jgi:hypothetical protein
MIYQLDTSSHWQDIARHFLQSGQLYCLSGNNSTITRTSRRFRLQSCNLPCIQSSDCGAYCQTLSVSGLDQFSMSHDRSQYLQTPGEDDYFNSVDEAPILMPRDSTDDLERMIQNVGPPQDTLEPIRWAKGQLIGAGAFGRVYMGMNLDSGELLAVKQVLLATNNTSKEKIHEHLKGLEAEVAVLRNLSHPNIVVSRIFGVPSWGCAYQVKRQV